MSQRAQIALYRLQRQDEAVARATQRLGNARSRLANAMSDKSQKAEQTRSAKAAVSHSDAPNAQRHFEEVVLPELKVQLELMERDEQQARIDETEAEQHLRDEQTN
jgi:hypothetical protein